MRKKILSLILTLCMLLSICQFPLTVSADVVVSMESTNLLSGATSVTFTVSGSPTSWVAIYPESTTTYVSGAYIDWMNCGSEGTYTFPSGSSDRYKGGLTHPNGVWTVPDGNWKIVVFADGGYTNIAGTCSFTVSSDGEESVIKPTAFSLEKDTYTVGEDVVFIYENSHYSLDWIGIYKASDTANKSYIDYGYTSATSGTVSLVGSKNATVDWLNTPGDYVAKYFSNGGYTEMCDPISFSIVEEEIEHFDTVYVSATGSDDNNGATAETPVATIANAIKIVGEENDGTIYVSGAIAFADIEHTGTITYEPADETGAFNSNMNLHGPSIINVPITETNKFVTTNGYTTKVGSTVNTAIYSKFVAGNAAGADETVYLNGGNLWQNVYTCLPGQTSGDVKWVIDGAVVRMIAPGPSSTVTSAYVGDVNAVVNSGELWYFNKGEVPDGTVSQGALQAVFNNNTFTTFKADYLGSEKIKFNGGKWFIISADTTGSLLDTTDTVGKYAVTGTKTAYVQSSDKKSVYYSKDGYITLPAAGKYTILWAENFSASTVALPTGALFWDDNGNGVMTAVYNLDTVYVSATGSDDNIGATAETPVATIAQAITIVGEENDGTIYIMDDMAFADVAHTGTITYTPGAEGVKFTTDISVSGPSIFELSPAVSKTITSNGHYVKMAAPNATVKSDINYFIIGNSAGTDETVYFDSGRYYQNVYTRLPGQTSGKVKLVVNGALLRMIAFGSKSASDDTIVGDIDAVINSGELHFLNIGKLGTNTNAGALQIVFNNNTWYTPIKVQFGESTTGYMQDWGTSKISFNDGVWFIRSADTTGPRLDTTDVTGKYAVIGDKTAYWQTSDKKTVYYSKDGYLTLPKAGTYDILWAENFSASILTLPSGATGWTDNGEGLITADYTPTDMYVSASGNDETGTGTEDSPLATIAEAIERKGADEDFTIYIMGAKYVFADAAHTGTITYEPYDSTATLAGGTIKINGPSKIHVNTAAASSIYPNGYDFELDGEIRKNVNNDVFVGNSEGRPNRVTLKGQYIRYLVCFSDADDGTSDTLITIDGAYMYMLCPTPVTAGSTAKMGDLRVVVNSGNIEFFNIYNAPADNSTDSGFVFVFNNNSYFHNFTWNNNSYTNTQDWGTSKVWFKGGEMLWRSADTSGSYLVPKSMTEFEVVGSKTAYYQTSDKKTVYYSKNGKITLPVLSNHTAASGKIVVADVSWTDDFSTELLATPGAQNGVEFVEWIDDGNGKITASYKKAPTRYEYYMKSGGTGDGTSYDTPAGNVYDVVATINADGHDESTEVTVYLIDSDEKRAVGDTVSQTEIAGYMHYAYGNNHTTKITYKPYNYETTGKQAVLYMNNAYVPYGNNPTTLLARGPVKFENLIIMDCRTDFDTDVYAQGHDMEFENVILRRIKHTATATTDLDGNGKIENADHKIAVLNSADPATIVAKKAPFYTLNNRGGTGVSAEGGTVVVDNPNTIFNSIRFGTYTDSASHNATTCTAQNSNTVVVTGDVTNVILANTKNDTYVTTFEKNVNLLADGATVTNFKSGTKSVVKGAIQVILNNGASLTNFTANANAAKDAESAVGTAAYYIMDSKNNAGTLDFAEKAGEFTVNSAKAYAYAYSNDADIAYYGTNMLKVAKSGKYVVNYAASVDEIMASLPDLEPNAETGEIFKGWKDNGDGSITPEFGLKDPVTKEYYVVFGGTGDGRTVNTPAASVNDVIAAVNADGLINGDTAKVYIMEHEDFIDETTGKFGDEGKLSTRDTLVQGTFTFWKTNGGSIPTHNATLLITSYDYEAGNTAKPKKHLAYSDKIGANHAMGLGGPTIFQDVNLVRPRWVDREIKLNGYYAEFNGVTFYQANADFYTPSAFAGLQEKDINIIMGGDTTTYDGGTLVLNSPLTAAAKNNHGIGIRAYGKAATFNDHVAIYLNNTGINSQFNWGNANTDYTTTLNKGFSIIVDQVGSIYYPTKESYIPAAAVTITGGLQIINNNGHVFPAVPSNVKADKTWIVNSAAGAGGTLDITETAGTFAVEGGKVAYAQSLDNKTVYYGAETITLPEGTWEIKYADDIAAVKANAVKPADIDEYNLFDSWTDDGNGTMTAKYVYVIPTYYVAATGGSDSNDGSTPEKAFATTTKAIEVIEANGKNGVVNVIGAVTLTLTAHENRIYWESYNGGTIAGASNKISLVGPSVFNADFAAAQAITTNGYYLELGGKVNQSQNNTITAGNLNGTDDKIVLRGKFVHKLTTTLKNQKTGGLDIFIDGGILRQMSTGSGVENDGTYVVGNVSVTVKSGEFWCLNHSDNGPHKTPAVFNYIANGNNYYFPDGRQLLTSTNIKQWQDYTPSGADGFVKILFEGGKYVIRNADKENFIYLGESAGKFTYEGAKTPYYVTENGLNVHYGKDGKIELPTGVIDVLWAESFNADDMPEPNLASGYEFGGWADDGNGLLTAIVINPNFYYVDGINGSDDSNGTEATPYKTISKAISALDGKNGTVYVIGFAQYELSEEFNGYVTIEGTTADAELQILTPLYGNVTLKNLTLPKEYDVIHLDTPNISRFEIDDSVTVNVPLMQIYAGGNNGVAERIVLSEGNFEIDFGSYGATVVDVVLNGTNAKFVNTSYYSEPELTVHADNATITAYADDIGTYGNIVIVANNSVINTDIVADNFTVINSNSDDGAHVAVSTTDGAYSVKAPYGKTPIAVAQDGTVYVAGEFTTTDVAPTTWYDRHEYDEYINYRKPLNNTYKKLTEDKELTVAYFGGSVTNGSGKPDCWRELIGQWIIDNFPEADVTNINRACGESGTYLGTFRLVGDVIAVQPDLLFLEYSINDKYYGSSYADAASQYETIVREVKQALPETDIVTVLVSDTGTFSTNKQGKLHTQAQAHEDMAAIYDIPTLHVGRRIAEVCNYTASNFTGTYATDIVHLTSAGNYIYYQVIEEYFHNSLLCTDFSGLPERNDELPVTQNKLFDGNRTWYEPTPELLAKSEALGGQGVTRKGGNSYTTSNFVTESEGTYIFDSTNDEFFFEFSGTDVALWSNYYKEHSFLISVDGGAYTQVPGSSHAPARIIEGLTSGNHKVGIKIADASTSLIIRSIYTRDTTKATPAGTAHTYTDYSNRTLTVPAGNYSVYYIDAETVADIPFAAESKIFKSWKDTSGNALASTAAVTPGMVIVPETADLNDYISFAGVQIRIANGEQTQGLRFVADKLDTLDSVTTLEEFGMVVIPSAMIGDDRDYTEYDPAGGNCEYKIIGAKQLYSGSKHTYNGKEYNSADVAAEKIFKQLDNGVRYTTCVTGILEENYGRYYTVKAYAKYTVNGETYVAYTTPFRSSIYEVAKTAQNDATLTADAKTVVDGIVAKVEG